MIKYYGEKAFKNIINNQINIDCDNNDIFEYKNTSNLNIGDSQDNTYLFENNKLNIKKSSINENYYLNKNSKIFPKFDREKVIKTYNIN